MYMYTIKSVSHEGTWYLVNGWRKHKAYWQKLDDCILNTVFRTRADAKRSLTKLLKHMMAEYGNDDFTLVMLIWNEKKHCYDEEIEVEKIILDN